MSRLKGLLVAVASVGALAATQAHAVALFQVEANPKAQPAVKLDELHGVNEDANAKESGRGVDIKADDLEDFGSGDATIKPAHGHGLHILTLDPANDDVFSDFSFRGQTATADSDIIVKVWDQNGVEQDFTFHQDKANQDFTRIGIEGIGDETISKIQIIDTGGFKELKQFSFSFVQGVGFVPEPSTWLLMIGGLFLLGTGLRMNRDMSLEDIAE
jgi:hypothetical protein